MGEMMRRWSWIAAGLLGLFWVPVAASQPASPSVVRLVPLPEKAAIAPVMACTDLMRQPARDAQGIAFRLRSAETLDEIWPDKKPFGKFYWQMDEARPTDVKALLAGMLPLLHRTLGEHIDVRSRHGAELWPATVDPVAAVVLDADPAMVVELAPPLPPHVAVTSSPSSRTPSTPATTCSACDATAALGKPQMVPS